MMFHVWIKQNQQITSKYQNHGKDSKHQNFQLKTAYIFMQFGFKFVFLNV
jgi:hypothetical protein